MSIGNACYENMVTVERVRGCFSEYHDWVHCIAYAVRWTVSSSSIRLLSIVERREVIVRHTIESCPQDYCP